MDEPQRSSWHVIVLGLFLTRFFVPTEGTAEGVTLWIAQAWITLAAIRCWWKWRISEPIRLRSTWMDMAIGLFIGAHLLSAGLVLLTEGDKRAALNSLWEWLSLGTMTFLLKDLLVSRFTRHLFLSAILISSVVLGGLGIWQHYVWYPRNRREVVQYLELHDRQQQQRLSQQERERFRDLMQSHGSEPLGYDETSRAVYLARVRDSVEPIGRFALANSFASLLSVGWMILLATTINSLLLSAKTKKSPFRSAAIGVMAVIIGGCLLLTKSRTAYLATLFAMVAYAAMTFGPRLLTRWPLKRMLWTVSGATGVFGGMVVLLFTLGGLDQQVLTEAPKSLSYRLEYWRATVGVIADHPWTGVGPGNFRQHYLQHKLPGSSEEVLDPHNMFMDVWANAGILAVVALIAIVVFSVIPSKFSGSPTKEVTSTGGLLVVSGLCALGAVLLEGLLFHGILDDQLLALAVGWVVASLAFHPISESLNVNPTLATVCLIALWIGFLAAGGIAMPALTQLVLVLLLIQQAGHEGPSQEKKLKYPMLLCSIVFGVAAVGCLVTGLKPVTESQQLLSLGQSEMATATRWKNAESYYKDAAAADPLSPAPYHQLADLQHWLWERSAKRDEDRFIAAIQSLSEAIARDPFAGKRHWYLGKWWFEHWEATGKQDSLTYSIRGFAIAADHYPNFAPIQAEWAVALAAAESDQAVSVAEQAIWLDDLNRANGHYDKLLAEELRANIEASANRENATKSH